MRWHKSPGDSPGIIAEYQTKIELDVTCLKPDCAIGQTEENFKLLVVASAKETDEPSQLAIIDETWPHINSHEGPSSFGSPFFYQGHSRHFSTMGTLQVK